MKFLKFLIIVLLIVVVALFTGTWLFDALAWFFEFLFVKPLRWLSGIFNFFGWNAGVF